jgi:hypothetical protein
MFSGIESPFGYHRSINYQLGSAVQISLPDSLTFYPGPFKPSEFPNFTLCCEQTFQLFK